MKLQQSIKVSHNLNLTPTLTQAIRLLQLSHLELLDEISKASMENPFLEAEMPSNYWPSFLGDSAYDFYSNLKNPKSLTDSLLEQVVHLRDNAHLLPLIEKAIYSLDERGMLSHEFWENMPEVIKESVKEVLCQLEPYGIGSTTLQECFLWQLWRRTELKEHPYFETLVICLRDYYDVMLEDKKKLISCLGLKAREFPHLVDLMQKLYSRPAFEYHTSENSSNYVPDLLAFQSGGQWHVKLNEESLPRVSLYQLYDHKRLGHKEIKELSSQAKWFIKTLQTRHQTLLSVGQAICEQQQMFFSQGRAGLKPLILEDISRITGFHESTISRITTNKYIQTPHGLYELKALLSRGLKTKNGDVASTASIKQIILQMVEHEDPRQPLSDRKIAQILKQQGYQIARRTIAKYREILQLGSSSERRK